MAAMATLGLLGGTSWESTLLYYKYMNNHVKKRLGGFHSQPMLLNSVDMAEFVPLQQTGDWAEAGRRFGKAAKSLVDIGAQAVMLCNNTFHIAAKEIQEAAGVPLLSIVDATADKIKEEKLSKVILLGTKYTMEASFFQDGLRQHNIQVAVPNQAERDVIHGVIYDELVQGIVRAESRDAYVKVIKDVAQREGAHGVICGCTEIGMLIDSNDAGMPAFDTVKAHAEKAVDWAIAHGAAVKPN